MSKGKQNICFGTINKVLDEWLSLSVSNWAKNQPMSSSYSLFFNNWSHKQGSKWDNLWQFPQEKSMIHFQMLAKKIVHFKIVPFVLDVYN